MQLEITADERELLIQLLDRALSDTRVEVRRTATPEFHDKLQHEERRLGDLLDRVRRLSVS
jgi:hypothetical protein